MRINDWRSDVCSSDRGLRFNAGVPLVTSEGFRLGTLCVIDKEMRTISKGQIDDLEDLSSLAMDQMELRIAARHAAMRPCGPSSRSEEHTSELQSLMRISYAVF